VRRHGRIRVVQCGLGPIGIEAAKRVMGSGAMELVGAADVDPQKAGRDLGEVFGMGRCVGITVSGSPSKLLEQVRADIAVHTTSSLLRDVRPQIVGIVSSGMNAVS
jgi:4-hydroxy-tetrahydrodipicolinate reductase